MGLFEAFVAISVAHPGRARDLTTPEKYQVYYNGSASPPRIYIQVSATQWERFDKDTDEPADWSEEVRFDADFLKNKQETYDGRVALNPDTDFDGVTNMAEVACGTNATNNDTDGDGLRARVPAPLRFPSKHRWRDRRRTSHRGGDRSSLVAASRRNT